ncbi:MAG: 50S ribosomal protein L6 [Patescibacteria group bacterium]|nr:50S ribosomal protein L6 [Patescibacteria group bacterium]
MSRIGKLPIELKAGITAELRGDNEVVVKGPKGELKTKIHPKIKVTIADGKILTERQSDSKEDKSLHGLSRTLIANMAQGVEKEFEKKLEIQGVGYKANASGRKVTLNLGFSHPIEYTAPEGITIEQSKDKKNIFTVIGINKQTVGEVAAKIRSYRPPEPYKGKGIRYVGEYVARKAGKTAASSSEG